jgi:hypothetical protein
VKRRDFLIGLATAAPLALGSGAAFAQSFAEDLIAQLTAMGFVDFDVSTTWLGRVKILATRADGVREIVLNPRTGEILRDFWMPYSGIGGTRVVLDDVEDDDNSGSGSDDDGGDDNSGPGGGGDDDGGDDNSGPGGGDEPDND